MSLSFKTILNATQDFGRCRIEKVEISKTAKKPTIDVFLVPKADRLGLCAACQTPSPGYDTQPARVWFAISVYIYFVHLHYAPRRVKCPTCGIHVEHMPWSCGKSPFTLGMMHFLARWARRISWLECSKVFQVSWDSVYRSVKWLVTYGLAHRKLGEVESLGVDEIHWGKGKKSANFLTVLYEIGPGKRLLWVGKKRTEASLRGGLKHLEAEEPGFCARIKIVCSDMWRPFLNVIRTQLSAAVNILDRFHIAQHLNRGVDDVRRGEQSKMSKAAKRETKGGRFVLLKKGSRVRGRARRKLEQMLSSMYETAQAWVYKEAFGKFWKYKSPVWAGAWLTGWIELVRASELKPMIKVADMLARHHDLLLNYFRAKKLYSSAMVEGLNNKARISLAKSYGHRSYKVMEVALYHALGDLPEPVLTHKFC